MAHMLREFTDELQLAIASNLIQRLKIKDICTWSRSAPGFYAAVDISKKGVWSNNALISASTIYGNKYRSTSIH